MKRTLTVLEASSIVIGAGVGGGVMAVPYLASRTGFPGFVPVVLIAFAMNLMLNLLLTEVLLRDGRDLQIVELIRAYVFRGRLGNWVVWLFFAVLFLSFVASLTAYVSGAGEVLASLLGAPVLWCRLGVYAVSALIVFFGLKSVGFSEQIALVVIVGFAALITFGAAGSSTGSGEALRFLGGGTKEYLALYGVVMYSLNSAFAVPQAVKGLHRDARRSVFAVVTGTAVNAALVIVVTAVAIAVSRPVTEVAVVGIGAATNRFVSVAGSIFVFVAMITTYWSVSLALADVVRERTRLGAGLAWLAATAPTLVLVVFGFFSFVEYMQIAGGIVALVVVFVTVPMYLRARRTGPVHDVPWTLGKLGSPAALGFFVAGMALMAIGSFLGIA